MLAAALVGFSLVVAATPSDRPYHELHAEIRSALRAESTAVDRAARSAAVHDLVRLHWEIVEDSRFSASPTLKEYRNQIAIRLRSVQRDLQRDSKREARRTTDNNARSVQSNSPPPATLGSAARTIPAAPAAPSVTSVTSSGGRGGAIGPPDDGLALVELIQNTIQPDHWNVNGGPGSIVYFAPLRCLVVRATGEVHHQVGGAVEGLRAAGR